jgi:plastocyanin
MKMNGSIRFQNVATLFVTLFLALFAPSSHGATVTVDIVGDTFSPQSVTVHVGDTVTWSGLMNSHNVTGSSASDLDQFCGSSLSSFGTESSCSHTFTTAGTFPYECTIHAGFGMVGTVTVVAAKPTPSVSITNPASGAVFSAPANLRLAASASVSSGTVTNVKFFNGTTSLGSVTASPFSIIASNLAANTYALTAVATAAGVSATSTVVNITVVSPVAVSNSAPQIAKALFSFNYSANVGLSYVVQDSLDLINWLPLITNVATVNSVPVTDTFLAGGQRFYRVVRQPNP